MGIGWLIRNELHFQSRFKQIRSISSTKNVNFDFWQNILGKRYGLFISIPLFLDLFANLYLKGDA